MLKSGKPQADFLPGTEPETDCQNPESDAVAVIAGSGTAETYEVEHVAGDQNGKSVEVVTLPCIGFAPPDLLSRTLDEGVANVHVIGCPLDDCANRESNIWLEQRITRERVPRLKRPYADAPITASWLPPDDFHLGVASIPKAADSESGDEPGIDYMAMRQMGQTLTWRNYIIAFLLLALVMVAQIFVTDLPFTP